MARLHMNERNVMMSGFAPPSTVTTSVEIPAGIDPGKQGYVVAEMPDGSLRVWKIPTYEEVVKGKKTKKGNPKKVTHYDRQGIIAILREMKRIGVTHVTLEAQQPTRLRGSQAGAANNAVRASFMTGYGFALWELGLDMVDIKFDTAWPSAWKRKMGIAAPTAMKDQKEREKETKRLAREVAQHFYPDHNFIPERCRVMSHDQCEAAILIHYGRSKGWT